MALFGFYFNCTVPFHYRRIRKTFIKGKYEYSNVSKMTFEYIFKQLRLSSPREEKINSHRILELETESKLEFESVVLNVSIFPTNLYLNSS